jgi:hypothetical protein
MSVHGESLKRFLPFYKSRSLVASSSPYNLLYIEKLLPIIIYYTLSDLLSCTRLQQKRLNHFARTMAQTTRFVVRKCLSLVALIGNYICSQNPRKSKFWTKMPNFQTNQYSRITCEREERAENFQLTAYTKSESENQTVTSFFL